MVDLRLGGCMVAISLGEARTAAAELQRFASRDRAILDSVGEGLYGLDLDGRITFINPAAARQLGYEAPELIGLRSHPTFHHTRLDGSPYPEAECPIFRACHEGLVRRGAEEAYWRKDGSRVLVEYVSTPIREGGAITGAVVAFRDIGQRKRVEEALRRERDLVATIMETSPVGMLRVEANGLIAFANAEAQRILGAPLDELVGRAASTLDWRKADDADGHASAEELACAVTMSTGRPQTASLVLERANGTRVWVNTRSAPLRDSAGRIGGCVLALEDVTERRRLEEQFHQSRKLEAIGRLAGGVAHDFNNLLTAILASCDLLLEKMPGSDPLHEEAREIEEAARKAAALTHQLLAFSRKQVVQPRVLDLGEVVRAMDKMLRRLIGEDIELVTVHGQALGRVKADPGQLEQVLVNLAVNARDAMHAGGRLTIETANVDLGEEQPGRHVGTRPGPYVMLAVSDTGCGMSEETQAHLFEPFFTTKESGKGTGLGLSTVYGIVKQAGGDIWVYSEIGKGSVFKIYLPRSEETLEAARETTEAPAARGTETVLLVEDEVPVRAVIARVLRGAGYTVLEAPDGEAALRLATSEAGRGVDLVVTDVVMPRLGGEELVRCLRVAHPGLKVLFVSGYTERGGALRGALDRDMAFLQKPFTPRSLVGKIRELLDRPAAGTGSG